MKPYNNVLVIMLQWETLPLDWHLRELKGLSHGWMLRERNSNEATLPATQTAPRQIWCVAWYEPPSKEGWHWFWNVLWNLFKKVFSISSEYFWGLSQGYGFKRSSLETLKWSQPAGELCHNVAAASCKLPMEKQISANAKTHHEETHKETGALQWNV